MSQQRGLLTPEERARITELQDLLIDRTGARNYRFLSPLAVIAAPFLAGGGSRAACPSRSSCPAERGDRGRAQGGCKKTGGRNRRSFP